MKFKTIDITARGEKQIQSGSLWVFANEFVTKMKSLAPGEWVNFQSAGRFVGFGYVNPHSLISGRICSVTPVSNREECLDRNLVSALDKRRNLMKVGSYRAVFSESDFLPGLIVDIYSQTVIAQLNTAGMEDAKGEIINVIKKRLHPESIVIRSDSSIRTLEGLKPYREIVLGDEAVLNNGKVQENDVCFAANLVTGQKTGFFLDQRDNRQHLKSQASGKTVLDLCSYSGGWGLTALKGGASKVTFVDQSQDALELAKKGLELNHFAADAGEFVSSDVFDFLEQNKNDYDIVVSDPPAFVKSKKNLGQAIKAYKKLNSLALRRVKSGGLLYTCSCSFHLSESEFESILTDVVRTLGIKVEVLYRGTQPSDHLWVLNRPESRYLKCYCLRVLG